MEIDYRYGEKHEKDRVILVTTREREPVKIFKLGLLVNQLAVNELRINDLDWSKVPFFFENFILEAVSHAKAGIDWAKPEYKRDIEEVFEKYGLGKEKIDYDLLDRVQRGLEEFEGAEDPDPSSRKNVGGR